MKYECTVCGYIYDEAVEGVKFEDLPRRLGMSTMRSRKRNVSKSRRIIKKNFTLKFFFNVKVSLSIAQKNAIQILVSKLSR